MEYPVLDARATGARIKELRQANHLKVEDVARFMGFESEQAVYKWQRGDSLPTVDNLYALSLLFGTSVDDILRGNREKDESPSLPVLWGYFDTDNIVAMKASVCTHIFDLDNFLIERHMKSTEEYLPMAQ